MTVSGVWTEPPWASALDEASCIRSIPAEATMTGMFLESAVALAKERGHVVRAARPRYVAFQQYPLKEHCQILLEVARAVYPTATIREALRRLGRGAPHVLLRSTLGRVVLGSVEGPIATLEAMARSYALHMRPANLAVEPAGTNAAIVRMTEIHNFLDSHNVGVFEGVLKLAKVEGTIRIRAYSRTSADFSCEW
ncbi:MAG TPA: DUF2378 family protein [Polyangiaceae bacterium]|nr:DUF2378 family protein [Polyangiaceae bacterium]